MAEKGFERKLTAILYTDVVGDPGWYSSEVRYVRMPPKSFESKAFKGFLHP